METIHFLVCYDCFLVVCLDNRDNMSDERIEAVELGISDLSAEYGYLFCGDAENELEFSCSPCECCGSNLAGTRHELISLVK